MKPARLIVLAIALVAGGIAAWLASGSRAPEPPKPAPAPPPLATVEVLVAKSDLGVGQVVGEQDVGWQIWPADAANSSFIKKSDRPDAIKDFVGAIVRSAVAAGEPIRDSKVVIAKNGGRGPATGHARDIAGRRARHRRRRLHPAQRSRRCGAHAPRQDGGKDYRR
jgi:pilus assembly protein CpaB